MCVCVCVGGGGGGHVNCNASLSQPNVQKTSRAHVRGWWVERGAKNFKTKMLEKNNQI